MRTNFPPLSDAEIVWLLACRRDEGDVVPPHIADRLLGKGLLERLGPKLDLTRQGAVWLHDNGYIRSCPEHSERVTARARDGEARFLQVGTCLAEPSAHETT